MLCKPLKCRIRLTARQGAGFQALPRRARKLLEGGRQNEGGCRHSRLPRGSKSAISKRSPGHLPPVRLAKSAALRELADLAKKKGLLPKTVSPGKLSRLAKNHQGAAVFAAGGPEMSLSSFSHRAAVLILDGLEDPKNLGAIIRTAWLMGAEGIFASRHRSAGLTPSAMKAACGGAEYLPVEFASLTRSIKLLKQNGFTVYGLDQTAGDSLYKESFPCRAAFALGGESSGLKPLVKAKCDKLLAIPQKTPKNPQKKT